MIIDKLHNDAYYYNEYGILFHGDCVYWMSKLPDNSIDLVVTSPPYDFIRDYQKSKWKIDLHSIGKQIFRLLKDGGICVIIIQDQTKNFAKSLTSFRMIIDWCDNIGFKLFECLLYYRLGTPGVWWNKRFRVDHEYMPVFFKGNKPKHFNKNHLMIPGNNPQRISFYASRKTDGSISKPSELKKMPELKCRGTVWDYTSGQRRRHKIKNKHPAIFPEEIPYDHILCWTQEGDIVLDPMIGSGTTAIQAQKLNRKWIGCEINKEYIDNIFIPMITKIKD